MIAPKPSSDTSVTKPACPMYPFFGVEPALLDEKVISTLNLSNTTSKAITF